MMKGRYKKDEKGRLIKIADIYGPSYHNIDASCIDKEVFEIAKRLQQNGFQAYLVGGAVRDLMLQKTPKDFDIVTDAHPNQIRDIFRNSRVIGKRFRLVHIFYSRNKIYEVITFRSKESTDHQHLYGSIDEDVQRRDFTINAFYYNLEKQELLDFMGGIRDVKKKQIRNIIPLSQIFHEDPVRIIRCIKYATSTGFGIPRKLQQQIKRDKYLLEDSSPSRLAEEFTKILVSDIPADILKALMQYQVFQYFLPQLDPNQTSFSKHYRIQLEVSLEQWQEEVALLKTQISEEEHQRSGQRRSRKARDASRDSGKAEQAKRISLLGMGLSYIFAPYFESRDFWEKLEGKADEQAMQAYKALKFELGKLNIPNADIEQACKNLFAMKGRPYSNRQILKRQLRSPRNRRPRSENETGQGKSEHRQNSRSSNEGRKGSKGSSSYKNRPTPSPH